MTAVPGLRFGSRVTSPPGRSPVAIFCVAAETYPPEVNGVSSTLAHLVSGLRAQGHTVSLVRPRQQDSDCAGSGQDSRLTLVRGLPLPGYKGLQFGLPSGAALRRSWLRDRPDAVYVATEGPLGLSAARMARRLGIPAFSGFHTNYHSYSKHYRLGWLEQWVMRYLRAFHNRTTGTLVPSPWSCKASGCKPSALRM